MQEPDNEVTIPLDRLVAVLRYRGMDSEAMVVAQKRNLQSLMDASELVAKGLEELASCNATLLREQMVRASDILPNFSKSRTLDEVAREQIDFSRETVEAAVNGFQELTDLMWKCNRQAVNMINRSMLDGLQALTKGNPFGTSGNGLNGEVTSVSTKLNKHKR